MTLIELGDNSQYIFFLSGVNCGDIEESTVVRKPSIKQFCMVNEDLMLFVYEIIVLCLFERKEREKERESSRAR